MKSLQQLTNHPRIPSTSSSRHSLSSSRHSTPRKPFTQFIKACMDEAHKTTSKRLLSSRRSVLLVGTSTLITIQHPPRSSAEEVADPRLGDFSHSDEEWKQILGGQGYYVMRRAGTERPWSSPLTWEKHGGTFACAGCGQPLFNSVAKFESGTGWPSFYEALPGSVDETQDMSIVFMPRTEVRCHRCQGHLGHVFNDGPRPTGLRYCMNGTALNFISKEAES